MRPELQQAMAELRRRGPESLDQALQLLHQTVFSFSMRVCGHREDAEDTAQETLLRTAPQLEKFESAEALAVWLYKVARSRCLMSRRRSKFAPRQTLSLDELLPDRAELEAMTASAPPGPEQQLLRKENAAELRAAVLRIPPQYRQVLVLHDMEELSTAEVAQITGLREGTVRVRLHRARAFLRNQLAKRPARRKAGARPRSCKRLFASLSDYLDHELDGRSRSQLESHLAGCAPCGAYLASLEETVRRCRHGCDDGLKAKLRSQLRELVRAAYASSK